MNWALLQNSLLVAAGVAVLAGGAGLLMALWLATLEARARTAFLALTIAALALPPFLVTNGWIALLGETGALRSRVPFTIYSLAGSVWILTLMLWPITTLATLAAWRRLEAAQFECEPALRGAALLRWLLWPAARGEVTLAALVTFVLALNNFAVPAILQTRVLPDEMWVRFNTQFDAAGALRLGLPLVIAPALLLVWVLRRGVSWPRVRDGVPARIFRRQLGAPWRIVCGAAATALCALSVGLPLAQIVLARRTWTELSGALTASAGATANSFWFAALTATAVVLVAQIAHLPWRGVFGSSATAGWPGRRLPLIAPLAWLAFFTPGVLLGIGLIQVFNRPFLAAFYQSAGIVLLALAIRYFALAWTATRHALANADGDLVDAARVFGAEGWPLFRLALWPQIRPQLFAGWYVVYLLCLWDVESVVLVQPPGGETLALKIFNLLHYGHAGQINALCLVLLGLALAPLLVGALGRAARGLRFGRGTAPLGCAAMTALLVAGCAPSPSANDALLRSRFFERAVVIGTRGVGVGEFNKPRSVAVDLNDNVYVADLTGRIQKFALDGRFLLQWHLPEVELGKPKGMGRDRAGNILVVEPHYQRVNVFSPNGEQLAQWGCKGTNAGCFMLPRAVAVNSRGEIFVSEYMGAERVQVFRVNSAGGATSVELLRVMGRAGTGPGEFNRPEGVCVDARDRLYVADSCNHRIQIFSADGTFLRAYGRAGSALGELSYPYDIAVDAAGHQFVCEFGNSRIQVFSPDGEPVEIIGGPGAAPGRFANPWSIALDSHGNLYVADSQNHRLQKLLRRQRTASARALKTPHPQPEARSGGSEFGNQEIRKAGNTAWPSSVPPSGRSGHFTRDS